MAGSLVRRLGESAQKEDHHRASNKIIKPGTPAPKSGQAKVVGPRGGDKGREVTVIKGKPMPPADKGGGGFIIVDPTKHKGD